MGQKIKFGDKEYEVENLSDKAKATLASLEFANSRVRELEDMQALMRCAKNSLFESIKQQVLSSKAGLLIGDD